MKIFPAGLLFVLFLQTTSCYYDVEEELYGTIECQTDSITYSGDVLPVVRDNCYQCHDAATNFGNVTLEGYTNIKTYVDNGRLLGVIRHTPGFSPMPKNAPQLVRCDIAKIEEWVAQGAPNN